MYIYIAWSALSSLFSQLFSSVSGDLLKVQQIKLGKKLQTPQLTQKIEFKV